MTDDLGRIVSSDDDDEPVDVHLPTCERCSLFNPYKAAHRFFVLIFMCFLSFGNYFCYDNPAALEDEVLDQLKLTANQYGILYTVYSWPNVVFAFIGGYLIDRVLGVRLGAIVFSFFIAAGQIIFATGAYVNTFWLMILGRFLFAMGGENLDVAQDAYVAKWFKDKELNTVFGIQLSFSRFGSTVNLYTMQPMYNAVTNISSGYKALGLTFMFAATATVVSWVCGIVLAFFDKRNDRFQAKIKSSATVQNKESDEKITLKDIWQLPPTFWLLCFICMTYYVALFPYIGFALLFLENKYQLTPYYADVCNSLIQLLSIVISPIFGSLVDYCGRNVLFILLAIAGTIGAHCLLAFTYITPFVPTVLLSLSCTMLATSLWPCVTLVVPDKALGTAYGLMLSAQNLGVATLYLSAGYVLEARGYLMLELYFVAWLCVSLGATVLLWFADVSKNRVLSMSKRERLKIATTQSDTSN